MGGGIWSMHFVAMLAFRLPGMDVSYDFGLTLLSLALPIIVTGIGFFVVRRRDTKPIAVATSGVIMGLGIVAMHYIGMAAMQMPAQLSYDTLFVALSVVIAIGASIVALRLAFLNTGLPQRLVAAVVMGLAIAGVHYTAMHAASFHADAGADAARSPAGIGQIQLALGVSIATFWLLFLALAAAIFDRRFAMLATREAAMLRESERRFRLLVEGVTDYSIFMLDPAGRITSWNSGAERAKGYRAAEIVGQHVSVFYSKEDRRAGLPERALQTARENGKFEAEGWRVRKDGSRFWASVTINPIYDDTGEHLGFAKLTRDVTERREAQWQLAQAQAKLLQSQKMEALGQLTGGVAHDFNNLLAVVLGNLGLLRKRLPDTPQLMKLLENAQKGAQRGAALTQRMLAFARRQELKPAAVDIPDLVRGMADLLQRTIGPEVRIETRFPVRLRERRSMPTSWNLRSSILRSIRGMRCRAGARSPSQVTRGRWRITTSSDYRLVRMFSCESPTLVPAWMSRRWHEPSNRSSPRREQGEALVSGFPSCMDWQSNRTVASCSKVFRERVPRQKSGCRSRTMRRRSNFCRFRKHGWLTRSAHSKKCACWLSTMIPWFLRGPWRCWKILVTVCWKRHRVRRPLLCTEVSSRT
jgi:PAS domain S-box-containing protein